ncbi:MAG: trigger factor [Bacteroidetes bacterium]|nr:trigger factor [Bacteroidota bacterium]
MNILQENIDTLNAVLKVQLTPEDYKPQVDDAIRKYKKKASMPGFRPGHVPENLVRKMYGKSVLVDELNRIVADSVDKFITDNKLNVLGNPMPKPDNDFEMNWDKPENFEFAFDLALAPEVNLSLPPSHTFTAYDVQVEEKSIDEEIDKLARRFGNYTSPEVTDADCSVYGTFREVDAARNVLEGGHTHQAFMTINNIANETARNKFYGVKVSDSIIFNPVADIRIESEVKYLLGIKEGNVSDYDKDFEFTIERINKVEKAEFNQALFDQVYGENVVTDIASFREKIRGEIAQGYGYESENSLRHEMEDVLLKEANLTLPDEFLKRWLKQSNEKITDEQLVNEYHQYARDLKWRLIENKIYADQNMTINKEEIENYARTMIIDQYMRYGQAHMLDEEKLKEMTIKYVSNQESVQRIVESLSGRKVFEYLNQIVTKDVKKIAHEEYVDLMSRHKHQH